MHDTLIYDLIDGKLVRVGEPKGKPGQNFSAAHRDNFLIVCQYGDWSGFRTLDGCIKQFESDPSLLKRPNHSLQIVERL
jgi:hypothetical protein